MIKQMKYAYWKNKKLSKKHKENMSKGIKENLPKTAFQKGHIPWNKNKNRYLLPQEKCHHLNDIKDDNRPQNLMAFTSESAHQRFHHNPRNVKPEEIIWDGRKL